MHYVYATRSGAWPWNGAMCHVTVGEPWHADDPFVAAHRADDPPLFALEPPKVRGQKTERVERATRRPGEKR